MNSMQQHLIKYARYHRDPRNINTHFIGIPLIVLSLILLLNLIVFVLFGITVKLGVVIAAITSGYYLKLDLKLGSIMAVFMVLLCSIAEVMSDYGDTLLLGVGLFVVGWVFQFVGHYFEGKKPAFVDDLMGLVIGPLFVVAEILFLIGFFKDLKESIEQHAGMIEKQT